MTAVFAVVLAWCSAHPLAVLVAVSVVCSLAHDYLERFPRVQGALKVLAGFGVDVPKIVSGITQALTGKGAIRVAAAVSMLALVLSCGCSGSNVSAVTSARAPEVVTYGAELQACVRGADGSLAAADECMRQVKAKWCGDGGAFAGHCSPSSELAPQGLDQALAQGVKAADDVEGQTDVANEVVDALLGGAR